MKAIRLILPLVALFLASPLLAQTPFWQRTNGPGGDYITGITFDSAGGVIVLSNNAFRTTDDGFSWEQLPVLPKDLHTIPNGDLVASLNGNVSISNDQGHSWKQILSTGGSIAVTTTGEIFVEMPTNTIFRSSNEGSSWDSLTQAPVAGRLFAFNTPTIFLLGNISGAEVLYRSTNNGADWAKVVNGLVLGTTGDDDMAGTSGGIVCYVSRFSSSISTDDGRTWQPAGLPQDGGAAVAISPQGIIGGSTGPSLTLLNISSNKFTQISVGIPSIATPEIQFDSRYLAASPKGEFWLTYGPMVAKANPLKDTSFSIVSPPTGIITALIADGSGNIIAASKASGSNIYDRIPNFLYRSTNAGSSWDIIPHSSALSPLVFDSSHSILTGIGGGVAETMDNASTWDRLGSNLTSTNITSLIVDPQGFIYMGCGEGVFRSTDNGTTWDQLNVGLTNKNVLSLTVNAASEVFAGTSNKIFHSSDHALSWQLLSFNPPDTSGITSLVVNTSGDILAVVKNAGVFWSHDDGQTWSSIGTGLSGNVNALLSTPSGHVFAGTDQGVFYLPSGGGTWVSANGGLGNISVLSITRDQAGTVYLGTDGSGVFRSTQTFNLPNNSAVNESANAPANIILGQAYPNPLSNIGAIEFGLPQPAHVRIELLNMLGEKVRLLADGEYSIGTQKLNLNATGLPNGVYQIILTSGTTRKIESIVISK